MGAALVLGVLLFTLNSNWFANPETKTDARTLSREQCTAEGGEVINTVSTPAYDKSRLIGSVAENGCPCVCLRKEDGVDTGIDISNWQTYRNTRIGFALKHPFDYQADISTGYTKLAPFGEDEFKISISPLRRRGNMTRNQFIYDDADYGEYGPDPQIARQEILKINGKDAVSYLKLSSSSNAVHYFIFKDEDTGLDVFYDDSNSAGDNPYVEEFAAIIDSFVFIE